MRELHDVPKCFPLGAGRGSVEFETNLELVGGVMMAKWFKAVVTVAAFCVAVGVTARWDDSARILTVREMASLRGGATPPQPNEPGFWANRYDGAGETDQGVECFPMVAPETCGDWSDECKHVDDLTACFKCTGTSTLNRCRYELCTKTCSWDRVECNKLVIATCNQNDRCVGTATDFVCYYPNCTVQ